VEDWKIKTAVLWSLLEFCMITVFIVLLQSMQTAQGYTAETPEMTLVLAVTYLIPPIMAFLSLTMKNSISRWVNIILSIFFIVMIPFGTGFEMIPTAYLPPMILMAIVEVMALVLIIWYAWKSKQKA